MRCDVTVEQEFWKWFEQHQEKYFRFDVGSEDMEQLSDLLGEAMRRVHPDLTFEFGPPNAKRDFVISAGGLKRSFPAVIALRHAAQSLENWQIIAFRPRREPIGAIEFQDKKADPQQVEFSLLDNGQIAGIRLFIPGFQEESADWKQIGYLLLDETLGEYDVETRLGLIKMYSPEAVTNERRYPLVNLPELFDRLVNRLENRSGKPS
jgi:hypothetical protein